MEQRLVFNFIKSGQLSDRDLNAIIGEKEQYKNKTVKAAIAKNDGTGKSYFDEKRRISDIYFPKVSEAPKTYNILQSLIIEEYAQSNLYVGDLSELQYVRYLVGGKFNWHKDTIKRFDENNKIRGLTFSINLTDDSDYEGGNLLVKVYKDHTISLKRERGSYIIFPSFLLHCVDPIVSGMREAVVVWTKLSENEIEDMKTRHENYYRNNILQ